MSVFNWDCALVSKKLKAGQLKCRGKVGKKESLL